MTIDDWGGPQDHDPIGVITFPNGEQVELAVRQLDGQQCTAVSWVTTPQKHASTLRQPLDVPRRLPNPANLTVPSNGNPREACSACSCVRVSPALPDRADLSLRPGQPAQPTVDPGGLSGCAA